MWWSYTELGWGGYWAWDPVENASLLPWLTGTAFLHSVMIQEKRGMLKVWNASLVLVTGILAIMGTFLVRSGILDSIHAFGGSTLGAPFLGLIVLMIGASVGLVVTRRASLKTDYRLESLLSREAIFLVQNLILVGLAFAIWWGTFFPLISEALTGTRHSLGPPRAHDPVRDRARDARAAGRAHPGRAQAARAHHVRPRGRGARRRRAGDRPRHTGPARDERRGGALRVRVPHPAQPPALRRLHRPCGHGAALRRRGRVVRVPA